MHDLPTYDDVIAAAARIAGHANRTPVMSSRTLDEELGAEVCGEVTVLTHAKRGRDRPEPL